MIICPNTPQEFGVKILFCCFWFGSLISNMFYNSNPTSGRNPAITNEKEQIRERQQPVVAFTVINMALKSLDVSRIPFVLFCFLVQKLNLTKLMTLIVLSICLLQKGSLELLLLDLSCRWQVCGLMFWTNALVWRTLLQKNQLDLVFMSVFPMFLKLVKTW